MSFRSRVVKLCKSRNITWAKLEKSTGISNGVVGKWDDNSLPSVKTLLKLSNFFNVTTDYLLCNEAASGAASIADDELELLRIYRGLNSQGKDYLMTAAASAASNAALTKKVSDAATA